MTDANDKRPIQKSFPTPEIERTVTMGSPRANAATPTVDPATLARLLPELEITEQIGSGGMGAVFRARHRELDRPLALKIIRADAASDTVFADRFAREARALAKLSHPHIVAIHDFGRREGVCYLTMELVDGVNLRELLRQGDLPLERVLELVPELCDALQYAHDHGVVHRDIKPENILIDRRGRARIVDFGLAKLTHDDSSGAITSAQQVFGTPRYMAPEQLESAATVDHRADIYSLGVVLYELLTGVLPVGKFAPPSRMRPVDPRLDEVILRSLERDPAERFQQVRELKEAWLAAAAPRGARRLGWPPVAAVALLLAGSAQICASAKLVPLALTVFATESMPIFSGVLIALWCVWGFVAAGLAIVGAIQSWSGSLSRLGAWGAAALCVPTTWACALGIPAAGVVWAWRRRLWLSEPESKRTKNLAPYLVCVASGMGLWIMVWGLSKYAERRLAAAAVEGETQAVAAALWWGAGLESRNPAGETPLIVAVWHRRRAFVEAILAAGAAVDAETASGETALMKAAFLGDEVIVESLLRRRPALDRRDSVGETALLKAAARGHLPVVVALHHRGASLTERDAQGLTPLLWATLGGHLDVTRFLASHTDLATRSFDGETLLHKAAMRGHDDLVEFALDRGIDVNAQDRDGETPLALGAFLGRLGTVRALLKHGADVELATNKGITPLVAATSQGHAAIVQTLLAAGANPQRKFDQSRTALHVAVESDQAECVDALVERWAKPPGFVDAWRALRLAHSGQLDAARQSMERALAAPAEDVVPWQLGGGGALLQVPEPQLFGWLLLAELDRRLENPTLIPAALEKARSSLKWTDNKVLLCQRDRHAVQERRYEENRHEEFWLTREAFEAYQNDPNRPLAIRIAYREELQNGGRYDRREGTRAGNLGDL